MNLIALGEKGNLVPAYRAYKNKNYCCLECGGRLRLRGGRHVRSHFYHFNTSPHCRQSGKSMAHLQNQLYLEHALPPGEIELEVPFPSIGRIADVVWRPVNIIFEVQCSPISKEEVEARNRDYASEGWQVIWLLHDQHFNQRRVRAAEEFLAHQPHYFTSINARREGHLYDQFSIMQKGERSKRSARFPIHIHEALPLASSDCCLKRSQRRATRWPFCFRGEISYCETRNQRSEEIASMLAKEKVLTQKRRQDPSLKARLTRFQSEIARCYRVFFYLLLERACRH